MRMIRGYIYMICMSEKLRMGKKMSSGVGLSEFFLFLLAGSYE